MNRLERAGAVADIEVDGEWVRVRLDQVAPEGDCRRWRVNAPGTSHDGWLVSDEDLRVMAATTFRTFVDSRAPER